MSGYFRLLKQTAWSIFGVFFFIFFFIQNIYGHGYVGQCHSKRDKGLLDFQRLNSNSNTTEVHKLWTYNFPNILQTYFWDVGICLHAYNVVMAAIASESDSCQEL